MREVSGRELDACSLWQHARRAQKDNYKILRKIQDFTHFIRVYPSFNILRMLLIFTQISTVYSFEHHLRISTDFTHINRLSEYQPILRISTDFTHYILRVRNSKSTWNLRMILKFYA